MEQRITFKRTYSSGTEYTAGRWEQICLDHEEEFPGIRRCYPGTFNVNGEARYTPPGEDEYRRRARERGRSVGRYEDGNHLSPRAKVIEINGNPVNAWMYRGGHKDTALELVSPSRLAELLPIRPGDPVTIIIELCEEGEPGMPGPPPPTPGKTLPLG